MLNPKAEVARASQALAVNMAGARGIQVLAEDQVLTILNIYLSK